MNIKKKHESTTINVKEIECFKTPSMSYFVVLTEEGTEILLRSLEKNEYEHEYEGRLYIKEDDDGTTLKLIFLDKTENIGQLRERAEKYSNALNERNQNQKTAEKRSFWQLVKRKYE